MINTVIRYLIYFITLILLQVLLFNNIQFSGYVNPFVYILFILLLPVEIPAWLLLILSFFTGFIVDSFASTPGMHTFATILAGFARPYILRISAPRDGYDGGAVPSLHIYGFRWFATYSVIFILIHHTALFYIEVFRMADFFSTLLRVLLSSLFSLAFILLIEFARKGR